MVIKLKGSCLKVKKECGKFVRVVFVVLVAVRCFYSFLLPCVLVNLTFPLFEANLFCFFFVL